MKGKLKEGKKESLENCQERENVKWRSQRGRRNTQNLFEPFRVNEMD